MKIYIAGKITGKENYKDQFARFEAHLVKEGHTVMNPAVLGAGFEYEDYIHICYAMIDVCDHVAFMHDWKDSEGARMEMEYAIENGKTVSIEHEEW